MMLLLRIWLLLVVVLVAPLCVVAVLVKTPGGSVVPGDGDVGNPTYRLWGKVYNASYVTTTVAEDPPWQGEEDDVTTEMPDDSTTIEGSTIEDTTEVQMTSPVECVDTEPMVWKGMLNCLRKRKFISCMSTFISRRWRRLATTSSTGRKKALRRLYLPLLLFFFKFKLLVVVLGMVAALAGKSAIMSVVSLAVAAGIAIKTSLGVHDYHNNKRIDATDLGGGGGQTTSPTAASFNNDGGFYG